jgi:hypothetical protein
MNKIRICAWDVGIKHLAYCIISKENDTFKIEKWNNIDVTEDENYKCSSFLKKKKKTKGQETEQICGAVAKYYIQDDHKINYYCGMHKDQNKDDKIKVYYENIKSVTDNLECQHLFSKKNKICGKKAKYQCQDTPLCTLHKEMTIKNKIKEMTASPIKKKKCTLTDLQTLCYKMYDKLDQIDDFKEIDQVYVENQPTFKNPTMKSVSMMLFSYFVSFFRKHNLPNKKIRFVSPNAKIKLDDTLIEKVTQRIDNHRVTKKKEVCKCRLCQIEKELNSNKDKHKEIYSKYKFSYEPVKELGIIYTESILIKNKLQNALDQLNSSHKKDDLCDAFLHGFRQLSIRDS